MIDSDPEVFEHSTESLDAQFITGSGLSEKLLIEAGAKDADLIVSATQADEVNILCCIMAKHLGTKHTIARVRNPDYALEFNKLWQDLGIDMVINPEQQTAREISRLIRYSTADDLDTFVDGRVELVSCKVSEAPDFFVGKKASQIFNKEIGVLLAIVERDDQALIPDADFVFEPSDAIRILGRPSGIQDFLSDLRKEPRSQGVMVIGGGIITRYLAEFLNRHTTKTNIKIIEKDRLKSEALSDALVTVNRRCMVIHGDGTNEELLSSEEISQTDAFVCLTDRDEENTIISLYALQMGVKKVITKINYLHQNMIRNLGLGLGSIITPQDITTDIVAHYVNGLTDVIGSNIKAMHRIFSGDDGNVEVLEFQAGNKSRCLGVPIKDLKLKKGVLVGCVIRNSDIIISADDVQMQSGDSIIIFVKNVDIGELDDILD